MILNGGDFDGRRYVSESGIRRMTSTQTGDLLNQGKDEHGYGLGWSTSRKSRGDDGPVIPGHYGHGGAYAMNMSIDPERKLVTILMVQHVGPDGGKFQAAFQKAVGEAFPR
jgi:CubicO group peptidase (beta-lactamase class C family)